MGCLLDAALIPYSDNQLVELEYLDGPPISNHTRVLYIQSTGSQYIDTLIPSGNDCILTIDGSYDRETGDSQHGTLISGSDGRYHMGIHYHSFAGGMYNVDMHFWYWDTNRHTFEMNGSNGYFYVDSDYRSLVPYQGSKSLNIYIFARNSNGTANCWTYFKLYECWIRKYSNNGGWIIARHFIPVKHRSMGACLYDTVSDTYFTNRGSGSFTAGPNI